MYRHTFSLHLSIQCDYIDGAHTGVPMAFATCEWGEDSVWTWGSSVAQVFRIANDVRMNGDVDVN